MAEEHKHDESVIAPEPAVEVVERESLMDKISEKIHHGGDSSSSSSSSDDEDEKKKTKKPSSPSSSMKSKVYRLFGREQPVHKVLGGGKRKFFSDLVLLSYICVCCGLICFLICVVWFILSF